MSDCNFFKNNGPHKLLSIIEATGAKILNGDENQYITDIATITNAQNSELTFLSNNKYLSHLKTTKASICIIDNSNISCAPSHVTLLIHPNPQEAFSIVANLFYPKDDSVSSISTKASIAKSAKIGSNVTIEDYAVIKENVVIGNNCFIGSHVTIEDSVKIGSDTHISSHCSISYAHIGDNCVISNGARIGQNGFGVIKGTKGIVKVPQLGRVIIGNNVEVGANTCIDRGALDDTIIGDNSKIDNLVQIAHNCIIGKSCFICGQTGLAGSSQIEDFVMLGGQVGLAGHLTIAAGTMVAAQSGVLSDVSKKSILGGTPALPIMEWKRSVAFVRKLIKGKS